MPRNHKELLLEGLYNRLAKSIARVQWEGNGRDDYRWFLVQELTRVLCTDSAIC